jgi:hypothetical protein
MLLEVSDGSYLNSHHVLVYKVEQSRNFVKWVVVATIADVRVGNLRPGEFELAGEYDSYEEAKAAFRKSLDPAIVLIGDQATPLTSEPATWAVPTLPKG